MAIKETTAETTVHSTQRTPQEIRKDFAEDWLETLGKYEIKINPWLIHATYWNENNRPIFIELLTFTAAH